MTEHPYLQGQVGPTDGPPLVVFSPLPPARSGIADYTAELLPALSARRRVVVVCDQLPPAPPGGSWDVIHLSRYLGSPALATAPHIYQIGNNADHVFVYRAFKRRPGILVQHDFNLHYLVEDATLRASDHQGYRDVLYEEYGDAGAALADLRHAGLFSEEQKIAMPLNTHLLRRAHGLVVHSQWVYARLPEAVRERTVVLPHHFSPQAEQYASLPRATARAELQLPPDTFIVLSLGYITPPKQIQSTLAALAMLRQRGQRFLFVIGGERNPGFDIDGHIRQHGLEDCVQVTGYLDEARFFKHIVAADALVNLRYPNVGESSGTLARALGLGLPAVVPDFGPLGESPDEAVLKVPLELGRPVALASALELLMLDPELRTRMGQAARRHMRAHCAAEHSAEAYCRLADRLYGPAAGAGTAAANDATAARGLANLAGPL